MTQIHELSAHAKSPIQEASQSRFATMRNALGNYTRKGLTVVILTGATALAACGGENEKTESTVSDADPVAATNPTAKAIEQLCSDAEDVNQAGENYKDGHFFPNTNLPLENNNQAAAITKSWFDKDGPLAGKGDAATSAIVDALLTTPFNAKDTNLDYNPRIQFQKTLESIRTGDTDMKDVCAANFEAVSSTFSADTIGKGRRYLVYEAVSSSGGEIVSYRTEEHVADATFPVVKFAFEAKAKANDKANKNADKPVYVDTEGRVIQLDEAPKAGELNQKDGPAGKDNKNKHGGGSRQHNNDQEGESSNGSAGGTGNGTTNGSSNNGNGKAGGTNKKRKSTKGTGDGGSQSTDGTGTGQQTTGSEGGGTQTGEQGCGNSGAVECGGGSGTDTGNEGTGGGGGSTGGGETGGGGGGGEQPEEDKGESPECVPNPPYVVCPAALRSSLESRSFQANGNTYRVRFIDVKEKELQNA
jgi:hypothetical protein